jgi:hypothetical protein
VVDGWEREVEGIEGTERKEGRRERGKEGKREKSEEEEKWNEGIKKSKVSTEQTGACHREGR